MRLSRDSELESTKPLTENAGLCRAHDIPSGETRRQVCSNAGQVPDVYFGSVRAHLAQVSPRRGARSRSTKSRLRCSRRAAVARSIFISLGGNWGYPNVHDIGNSGKDG
jgi:hypothetical protein